HLILPPPSPTLFPYTTLFRSDALAKLHSANPAERPAALHDAITMLGNQMHAVQAEKLFAHIDANTFEVATNVEKSLHDCFATLVDRKSTRLNSSHGSISYAVF